MSSTKMLTSTFMHRLHGTAGAVAVVAGITAGMAGAAILNPSTAHANWGSDPYSSDGTWLVPTEITPGTYRVAAHGMGYSKLCADYTCEIGTNGFISNELYRGPGVLVIPSNAVSVELSNISLTRMG